MVTPFLPLPLAGLLTPLLTLVMKFISCIEQQVTQATKVSGFMVVSCRCGCACRSFAEKTRMQDKDSRYDAQQRRIFVFLSFFLSVFLFCPFLSSKMQF